MTVEQPKVIDITAFDRKKRRLYLVISDHLGWAADEQEHHLLCLQEKINNYLYFIESGQLVKHEPDWAGVPVTIKVGAAHVPRGEGAKFHKSVRQAIADAGVAYELEIHPSGGSGNHPARRPGRAKRPGRARVTPPAGRPRARR